MSHQGGLKWHSDCFDDKIGSRWMRCDGMNDLQGFVAYETIAVLYYKSYYFKTSKRDVCCVEEAERSEDMESGQDQRDICRQL
eukprot:scaffold10481_cov68-Cyclotella_meneghiniana.AAC.9